MCNPFTFHYQSGIDTWRSNFEQQTESILSACGSHGHKPEGSSDSRPESTTSCTIHADSWEETSKHGVLSDIKLAQKEGLKFYQTRSDAIILHETLPACCIRKVVRMETGKVIYEIVYMSPQLPPKISLKHDWMKELGSEVAQRPEAQVQQSQSSQSNQPALNPIRERSERFDSTQHGRKTSYPQEIDVNSFCDEPSSSERTVRPVETNVNPTRSSEDQRFQC